MPRLFNKINLDKASKGIDLQPYQSSSIAPNSSSSKWPYYLATAGQSADIASTLYGMNHGLHESNPLLPKQPVENALVKSGATALADYIIKRLNDFGHTKAAKMLGLSVGASGMIPAAINLSREAK